MFLLAEREFHNAIARQICICKNRTFIGDIGVVQTQTAALDLTARFAS